MKKFESFLKSKGFSEEQISKAVPKLLEYRDATLKWNNKVNLTSITNPDDFLHKHYVDSLLCSDAKELLKARTILDVGTGAGFPGIPLAIFFPEKKFVLLDSLQKRLKIVREMADDIGLQNIEVVHGRAEDLARMPKYREQFDLCVSRAVANLSTLSELCLPFVKVGGTLISYKGPNCNAEVSNALNAISALGGKLDHVDLPRPECYVTDHTMIYIHKESKTPLVYPRKAGTPAKEPIK
jgi:16S rRNA (guanine527-N7)-methyltransferase